MAAGDFQLFEEWLVDDGEGDIHDYEADSFKLALITNGIIPTAADATPMWSVSSGTDYDTHEVSTGGTGYNAGGLACANASWVEVNGVGTFDLDNPAVIAQDGAGFTNAYYGILYNDTATNKNAIGFLDMGGPVSRAAGPVTITIAAGGVFTKSIV